MPAFDLDRGAAGPGARSEGNDADAPHAISSHEEQTRPVRPSANLAAAAATATPDDEESRRPTGEVPSVGHELRAKAPDQRVHTSPIGNILPSDVLQTLDDAASAANAVPRATLEAARSSSRKHVQSAPLRPSSGSGPAHRPSGPNRTDRTDRTPTDSGRHAGERRGEPRGERSGRRPSPKIRRPGRSEFPALSSPQRPSRPVDDEPPGEASWDTPSRPAPNAPIAIGFESTHYIPRRRRSTQLMQGLRAFIWGLLWLGLGGAVAFGVVVLYRLGQTSHPPPKTPPPVAPVAPPRRVAPALPKGAPPATTPRAALASPSVPLPSSTRARDLVVPIPAAGDRPPALSARTPTEPGAPPPPASGAPAIATPGTADAPPPTPPLDPQQQAAADQTMSNIEFVISERVAQVRACYDRAVRSAGPDAPAGRVEVSLTLSDEGQATSVTTVGNTVGIPQLAGCLEQRITEWRFPRPLGTARTFRLPFTFSPSPQQSGPRPRH